MNKEKCDHIIGFGHKKRDQYEQILVRKSWTNEYIIPDDDYYKFKYCPVCGEKLNKEDENG